MNLCFDIGNTKVGLALFSGGKLIRQARLEHGRTLTHEGFFSYLEKVIGVRSIKKAAIVSVVPEMTRTVSGVVRELLGINPLVIHSRLLPGFRLSYRRPEQLGADRMMNGYAAWKLYGGPAVVVDIGTAVTWDAVDAKGVFRGGARCCTPWPSARPSCPTSSCARRRPPSAATPPSASARASTGARPGWWPTPPGGSPRS